MSKELAKVEEHQNQLTNQTETANFGAISPANREQFEMLMELQATEKSLEALLLGTTKPRDLAASGVIFSIVDAWNAEIRDKDEMKAVVCFQIVENDTNITHIVMQSANSIREQYAKMFGAYKAFGQPKTLPNMQFVESDNPKHEHVGNKAIILRQAQVAIKSANK